MERNLAKLSGWTGIDDNQPKLRNMNYVSIRTLKRKLRIARAATFRHFLNCFEIDERTYGEFIAATLIKEDLANFLAYNQFFLREFEKDFYTAKTSKEIATKINRQEEEIIDYLEGRNINTITEDQTIRYISSYRIDWKLGGNYAFLNLLREVSKKELEIGSL